MRKIIYILLLLVLPNIILSQNSWVNIQLLTDDYPEETSWTITPPGGSPIIAQSDSLMTDQTLYSDTVAVGGDIIFSLFDQYGDGLGGFNGSPEGWLLIQNDCQDTILYVAGDFGFDYIDTLTIAPCAPPVVIPGCIDTNATNYDSTATQDDGSCTYLPCDGFLSSTASQTCLPGGQTLVFFNWTLDNNVSCEPVKFWYSNEEGVGPFQYGLGPGALDFAVYAGNGQMPPNWEVEHYGQVEFADGSLSDTIFYTPTPCIAGCTDPTQISYNPWATYDDGSCSGTTCDTTFQYQITMEITLDNWPGETSWLMNSAGVIGEEQPGAYDFNDIGQTYTYTFCVDQNAGFELVVNDTYGDGMAGSTSGGSMDGMIVIYNCDGDTIWYMDNPGFGNVLYSGQQLATPCPIIPPTPGCMDDDYVEFDPQATIDDGSCSTLHVYGCTNPNAFNYDSNATMMDLIPDCNYLLEIFDAAGDGWGNSYIGVYQNGINLGTYTMGPGNYDDSWNIILDPGVPVEVYYFEVGGPQQPPQEVQFQTWHNSFKLTNANGVVLLHEGQNPFANNGQGALQSFESPFWTKYIDIPFCGTTCIPTVLGCMDSNSFNYDPNANVDDNTCIPFIYGCTNEFALNYDSLANIDDGNCIPIINGCTDANADNYNSNANTDDGSCYYVGCTDSTALNYDSTATVNNGCIYPSYGCTDPTMFNYDPQANVDDGTCIPFIYGCMDASMFNYDPLANVDNGSCEPFVFGCMDSTMFNFNPLANVTDNSCIPIIYGCTDPSMLNYNVQANTEDFSCIAYIYGCTDSSALNYDPLANTENGSCIEVVTGCMDQDAWNYEPLANVNDSLSCLYDAGCVGNPGEPYWLNDECYAWVISVDDYCCNQEWDETCQLTYDYCGTTWTGPEPPARIGIDAIILYPNPTPGIVNIAGKSVNIKVYNHLGKLIITETNASTLDLSNYADGIYHLHITLNDKTIIKKIIKN